MELYLNCCLLAVFGNVAVIKLPRIISIIEWKTSIKDRIIAIVNRLEKYSRKTPTNLVSLIR